MLFCDNLISKSEGWFITLSLCQENGRVEIIYFMSGKAVSACICRNAESEDDDDDADAGDDDDDDDGHGAARLRDSIVAELQIEG